MGRRKVKRKIVKKSIPKGSDVPLETEFDCPFCNHEKSCEVKMDLAKHTARIFCRVCTESFQTRIHHLSHPIDVFNDWIDACEEAN